MNSALIRLKLPRLLYALLYGPSKTRKPPRYVEVLNLERWLPL